jgi:serine/threonine protein kinase
MPRIQDLPYARAALSSGLVTHDELERVEQAISGHSTVTGETEQETEHRLAEHLVQLKILTQPQSDRLRTLRQAGGFSPEQRADIHRRIKKLPFARAALSSGLVTHDELQRAELAISEFPTPEGEMEKELEQRLAEQLIQLEILTRYQSDQLSAGRTKFRLGPYIITDWLGQGGMGQVFKAVHNVMGREIAVKVLPLDKSTPYAIANFSREIRTQAQLDHPHLVRAYDAGHDGNVHYLVTEFVPGTDLRKLVRSEGPLEMPQAASVIMQAALGLEYAHQKGLIHRDVKPGNVMVTPEGVAKVSDLGLAGFVHAADDDPRSGKIVGTADYLSPEQIRTPNELTPVSDIYSLGCTLYYAITGKVPYPGGSTNDKAHRHLHDHPWHPRRFNANISEEFVEIIADMMEKDPAKRIGSCAEVVSRLEPCAGIPKSLPARQMVSSPWSSPPLPGQEDLLKEGDETNSPSGAVSSVTQSTGGTSQDTQVSQGPAAPPLALVEMEPVSIWQDTQTWTIVGIALAVGFTIGILSAVTLSWFLP